ncbi:MAG: hypothetical protein ACRCTZ_07975 [Sarcina sp.]
MKKINDILLFMYGKENRFDREKNRETPLELYIKDKIGPEYSCIDEETKIHKNKIILMCGKYELEMEEWENSLIYPELSLDDFVKDNKLNKFFFKRIISFIKREKICDYIPYEDNLFYSGIHFMEIVDNKIRMYYSLSLNIEKYKDITIKELVQWVDN